MKSSAAFTIPRTLTIRETRFSEPSIERICDKRLSPARRAWPYASFSVTPRPTFPCFFLRRHRTLSGQRQEIALLYAANEIGNGWGRATGKTPPRGSEPFLRGGQAVRVKR